jgi:putative ABC transport system permease protein
MGQLVQDIRYGVRMLAKNPGFALIAVLTLALGIGANTAIFSLTDQVLLRLLPVERPQELVVLRSPGPVGGRVRSDGDSSASFSYPMYKNLRDQNPAFSGLLARFAVQVSVAGQGQTELANGELVTGNYFEVLGVRPALGRVFSAGDETAPGANTVVVLSYGYWSRHYGSDSGILNKILNVNGTPLTVVGVARAGFEGVQVGQVPDLFIPVTMKARMTPNWDGLADENDHWIAILGRLKPGFTRAKAETAIAPSYRALLEAEAVQRRMSKDDKLKFVSKPLVVDQGEHGRQILQADAKQPLITLMAMVGLVLLIACANLASLLVARSEARQREIALRLALGASRWRLLRQLLTESLLLGIAGGVAGLLLGSWTLRVLVGSIPESIGAVGLVAEFDGRVLAFALALSLFTSVLFGFLPALRATRTDLQSTLKDQGTSVSSGKTNVQFRKWLMISQVALTVVLLVVAGFFAQSLLNLKRLDLGLRTDHVVQFSISPELNRYTPAQTIAFTDRVRETIAGLPGVRAVSATEMPVLANSNASSNITPEGYTASDNENMDVNQNSVGPAFFTTLGIPLASGREFDEREGTSSPKVAIVNETMAHRFFPGRNPLGLHFAWGAGNSVHPDIEIVGVVKDSKQVTVREEKMPFVYTPYTQSPNFGNVIFYVRTGQDPMALGAALRKVVQKFDSNLPIYDLKTLAEQINEIEFSDRLLTFFSLCLGLLAALLAAVGLYGVMAYMVARRTREIGIRMALGATQGNAQWLILREVVRMSLGGLAIGLPVAYGIGRLVESQLFGVKAGEPLVFVAATALLAVVAMAAGWLPSRKAAGVDPMVALRYE